MTTIEPMTIHVPQDVLDDLRERLARKRKDHLVAYIFNWTKDQERITGDVYEVANMDDPETGKDELIEFIVENGVPTTKYGKKDR